MSFFFRMIFRSKDSSPRFNEIIGVNNFVVFFFALSGNRVGRESFRLFDD